METEKLKGEKREDFYSKTEQSLKEESNEDVDLMNRTTSCNQNSVSYISLKKMLDEVLDNAEAQNRSKVNINELDRAVIQNEIPSQRASEAREVDVINFVKEFEEFDKRNGSHQRKESHQKVDGIFSRYSKPKLKSVSNKEQSEGVTESGFCGIGGLKNLNCVIV
jgi:hypothetical protein